MYALFDMLLWKIVTASAHGKPTGHVANQCKSSVIDANNLGRADYDYCVNCDYMKSVEQSKNLNSHCTSKFSITVLSYSFGHKPQSQRYFGHQRMITYSIKKTLLLILGIIFAFFKKLSFF